VIDTSFWIAGEPATFATAREAAWKASLRKGIAAPTLRGRETGLVVRFAVSSLRRNGEPFDVDNLCDPVFVVLIRQAGWFGGRKTGLTWWEASKRLGQPCGCQIDIHEERSFSLPDRAPFWDEIYCGALPTSGSSPEMVQWAIAHRAARAVDWVPETCVLYLGFADGAVNIGEISTGRVKSAVDCLYPWLGGTAEDPEDWRVETLIVLRGDPTAAAGAVRIRLWENGRTSAAPPTAPAAALTPNHAVPPPTALRQAQTNRGFDMQNPCREGTAMWIVCEAAFARKTLAEVRADLDRNAPGSGARLLEYKGDLRNEKTLDVRIEGDRIVCYGSLK
jgi:hypothetical protein